MTYQEILQSVETLSITEQLVLIEKISLLVRESVGKTKPVDLVSKQAISFGMFAGHLPDLSLEEIEDLTDWNPSEVDLASYHA